MGKKRRNFSAGFKSKVALEAVKEELSLNELAAKYEVHPNMIRGWKKQFLENCAELFVDKRKKQGKSEETDSDQLFKQIGQLKVENDWLKKKLGFEG